MNEGPIREGAAEARRSLRRIHCTFGLCGSLILKTNAKTMDIHLHSEATFNIVSCYFEVHQIGAGLKAGVKQLFIPMVLNVHQFEICL